nr:hypothetical protein CFP56_46478 [Quercus suber]
MSEVENSSLALSSEETDHLIRSTKKQKSNDANFFPQRTVKSYKDSLTQLSSEWENHLLQNMHIHNDNVGSDLNEDPDDPYPTILLSSEEKQRTRAPWRSVLIVKAFGKSLGFKYLNHICAIWKPQGDLQCIDLDLDYYLI